LPKCICELRISIISDLLFALPVQGSCLQQGDVVFVCTEFDRGLLDFVFSHMSEQDISDIIKKVSEQDISDIIKQVSELPSSNES
jgi:hypothetical protein